MTALFPNDWKDYLPIFFISLRWAGFSLLLPGLSLPTVPKSIKVFVCLSMAVAFFPFIDKSVFPSGEGATIFWTTTLRELFLGFALGFVLYVTFEAVSLAFSFISQQMGLHAQSMLDPSHPNTSVLSPFQNIFCVVLFFLLDFHHLAIQLFFHSYKFNVLFNSGIHFDRGFFSEFLSLTIQYFILALKISAPFNFILFLLNLGFGVLNKFIPQFNLIYFSFPISFMLGLWILFMILPEMSQLLEVSFENALEESLNFLRTFG